MAQSNKEQTGVGTDFPFEIVLEGKQGGWPQIIASALTDRCAGESLRLRLFQQVENKPPKHIASFIATWHLSEMVYRVVSPSTDSVGRIFSSPEWENTRVIHVCVRLRSAKQRVARFEVVT